MVHDRSDWIEHNNRYDVSTVSNESLILAHCRVRRIRVTMTDPESVAPQAANEGVSVRPKSNDAGDAPGVGGCGHDESSDAPRNVQRRQHPNRRLPPRQNSQDGQRPHNSELLLESSVFSD